MRVLVKTWDEMLEIGIKRSDMVISLDTSRVYTSRMHHMFLEANFIVNIKQAATTSDYDFECINHNRYFLSKEMIKRKAYKNDL